MSDSVKNLFTGIFVLILALFMWRATANIWAWLVFFIPGASLIVVGLWQVIKERY